MPSLEFRLGFGARGIDLGLGFRVWGVMFGRCKRPCISAVGWAFRRGALLALGRDPTAESGRLPPLPPKRAQSGRRWENFWQEF